MTIRVAVADDQALVRDGLRVQLGLVPDLEVVGEASTGVQAVALARRTVPDVMLMDVRMPELDGIEATRQICSDPATESVKVVVLTTFDEDEQVYAAIRAGASGYLLKDVPAERLVAAVRAAAVGDAVLSGAAARRVAADLSERRLPPAEGTLRALTGREREVLALMAQGMSNGEIAVELVIGEGTVKTHVARILMKLGVRDRLQAVVLAHRASLS